MAANKPKEKVRFREVAKIAFGFLVAFGLIIVAPTFWVWITTAGRVASLSQIPKQPVLVLGAGLDGHGHPSPFLAARLDLVVKLYEAGKTDEIIVSGSTGPYYSEPKAMAQYLEERGIPKDIIVFDNYGMDTYQSMVRARDIFHLTHFTVVSQAYHVPRALAIADHLGLKTVGFGDRTVEANSSTWRYGVIREMGANWKMVWDFITNRPALPGK